MNESSNPILDAASARRGFVTARDLPGLLLLMCAVSYVFVVRALDHSHTLAEAELGAFGKIPVFSSSSSKLIRHSPDFTEL